MLSISTSWNSSIETNWHDWLTQIKKFGLNTIELSYTLNVDQLKTIESLLPAMEIKVSSIHSFCPIPNDEPSARHISNYYRLSSLDAHERAQAVKWTKICIDTAKRVGAQVVVIHAGTLELTQDPSTQVLKLFKEGQRKSPEFQPALEELIRVRREKKGPYIEALEQSLLQVVTYAHAQGIKIGLETRYYPIEIPNFEEVEYFLNLFGKYGMHYWHDVGHAEINERLGISSHIEFLKKYQDRMIGVHLHGIKIARDHLAPFDGDMDLNRYLPFIKKDMIKVIEARYATVEQIQSAVEILKHV